VYRSTILLIGLMFGCAAVEDDPGDSWWVPEATREDGAEATVPDVRPDGISLDSPLPDGYAVEVTEATDGCGIRNACGGCGRLRSDPGTPCGGCGGEYVCNGPEDVLCDGGCNPIGCSDFTREGFLSPSTYPEIAACAGGFSVAGITGSSSTCGRAAGNSSLNPSGTGCSLSDLCAEGWHPCGSPAEVRDRTTAGIPTDFPAASFFAAAVSGPASDEVCGIGTNDFYGVGTAGSSADRGTCAPLNRSSGEKCDDIPPPWACEDSGVAWQYDEAARAVKPGPGGGGALCCLGPGI
jgi:hypothetical protein